MAFLESVRDEAKKRAHFKCVVCHEPWVEVHHIQAQADGGSDSLENAAPLCASCHHRYGGNPELRKQLKGMRDHWWERCQKSDQNPDLSGLSQKLDSLLRDYTAGRAEDQALLDDVKRLMGKNISLLQSSISSATTAPDIVRAVVTFATGSAPEDNGPQRERSPALTADAITLLKLVASEGGAVNQHSESHTEAGLNRIRYEEAVANLLASHLVVRETNSHHTRLFPRLSLTSTGRRWAIANRLA